MPHSASDSILGEISGGEIALFVAGVVFTFILLAAFIMVMIRASKETSASPKP